MSELGFFFIPLCMSLALYNDNIVIIVLTQKTP